MQRFKTAESSAGEAGEFGEGVQAHLVFAAEGLEGGGEMLEASGRNGFGHWGAPRGERRK